MDISINECGLSTRTVNALKRAGFNTLGEIIEKMNEDPINLLEIRNLGKKSLLELVEEIEEQGIDCYKERKLYGFPVERREGIAKLELSVRLYNILIGAGLDSLEKIEEAIKTDPFSIIKLNGMGKKTIEESATERR